MTKIFIDTGVCLDMLAKREPHYLYEATLFILADKGELKLFVSSFFLLKFKLSAFQTIFHGGSKKNFK